MTREDLRMDPVFAAAVERELAGRRATGRAARPSRTVAVRTAIVTAVVLVALVVGTVVALRSTTDSVPAEGGECPTAATAPFCPAYRGIDGEIAPGAFSEFDDARSRLLVTTTGHGLHLSVRSPGGTRDLGFLRPTSDADRWTSGSLRAPRPGVAAPGTVVLDVRFTEKGLRLVLGTSSLDLVPASDAAVTSAPVPWTALQPGPTPTTAPVVPTASAPACTASGLTVTDRVGGGAAGTFSQAVEVTNPTSRPCTLTQSAFALRIRHGGRDVVVPSGLGRTGQDGFVVAGRSTFRMLLALPGCGTVAGRTSDPIAVLVAGRAVALPVGVPDALVTGCSEAGHRAGPSFGQDGVPDPTGPYSALTATITVPASVRPGTEVGYSVAIGDPTGAPITFTTCPTYDESVVPSAGARSEQRYTLNCSDARTIPAHGSVVFAMRIAIPESSRGETKIGWALESPGATAIDVVLRTLG